MHEIYVYPPASYSFLSNILVDPYTCQPLLFPNPLPFPPLILPSFSYRVCTCYSHSCQLIYEMTSYYVRLCTNGYIGDNSLIIHKYVNIFFFSFYKYLI